MKKKLLIALVALVVVAIGVGVFVFSNLDSIVRLATERVMRFVLQVDVRVGGASVDVRQGQVAFTDIVIPNPPGYDTDRAMRFGLVKARVDIKSFRTDEPVVTHVQLSETEITLEARRGGSNLQDLLDTASRLASGEKKPPPKEEPKGAEKHYKIEKVIVDGTTARVAVPFLGGRTFDVPLPVVELEDLGGKSEGATPAEAIEELLAGILGGIAVAGGDILPAELLSDLTGSLAALSERTKEQIRDLTRGLDLGGVDTRVNDLTAEIGTGLDEAGAQAQETARDAAKELDKAAESVGQQLDGFLGRRQRQ